MRRKCRNFTRLGLVVMVCTLCYHLRGRTTPTKVEPNEVELHRSLRMITRNPKRKIVYSYSIDNKAYISNSTIDLSQEMVPDLSELDRRIVIVSGFGENEALNGLGMIASIQAHMPTKQIIIYNFGIHPRTVKSMKAMCNVNVRKLPYNNPHVQHHENGAWKLLAITDLLKEYGAVFFTSPRVRFRAPLTFLLPFVKKHNGIIGKVNPGNKTVDVTHPNLYRVFNLSHVAKTYQNGSILSENALLLVNNSAIYTTMLKPLRACALKWKCIAPAGSTKRTVKPIGRTHTHRYEMSVFTLLMYRNFGDKWLRDTHVQDLMNRTYELVSSSHANDHLWAHFCNPPKKEVNCKKNESKC